MENVRIRYISYILTCIVLVGTIQYGMLPGLLSMCVGYLVASLLTNKGTKLKLNSTMSAAIVITLPIVMMIFLLANAKGMLLGIIGQYQLLINHLANTVLEIIQKMPTDMVSNFPDEVKTIQDWITTYLKSQVKEIAGIGKMWMQGFLITYVGLVIGALIKGSEKSETDAPLRKEIRERGTLFVETFKQIIVAQFWIATVNMFLTAALLFVAMPIFGVKMPHALALVTFTFVAGLVPIVGNLVCNGVITIAGISVSPAVGVSCLIFLIAIHKFEYVINAKLLGKQTKTSAWELLAVMFVGESMFGVTGLVAGPLYYTYCKKELQKNGMV